MPTAPPSVTDLPTPPSRSDSANFAVRGDAFLGALPTFQTETNAVAANAYANALEADADAAAALAQATSATASAAASAASASASATAAGATIWVSGTTYAIGDVRWSPATRYTYRRITNGAGTTDPSADPTNWTLAAIALPAMVLISAATTTLVANQHAVLQNASATTATLPATPAAGDAVWVSPGNGRADNVIARNGSKIMGITQDLTVDDPDATVLLRYIDATTGWRVLV